MEQMADWLKEISIEFDRVDRKFKFREEITGIIVFTPTEDLQKGALSLNYQCIIHGQGNSQDSDIISKMAATEQCWYEKAFAHFDQWTLHGQIGPFFGESKSKTNRENLSWYETTVEGISQGIEYQQSFLQPGGIISKSITAQQSWNKEQTYKLPFTLTIMDGPSSYHGWDEKIEWFMWVTISTDGKQIRQYHKTKISLTGKTGLIIKNRAVTDMFQNSMFLMTIIFLTVIFLFIVVWIALWPLSGADLLVMAIGLLLAIVFARNPLTSTKNQIFRGFAEINLGIVKLNFTGFNEVHAEVTLHPRRKVLLKGFCLRTTVVEITTKKVSGWELDYIEKVKKLLSYQSKYRKLYEEVEPGQVWTGSLTIPLTAGLPPSDKYKMGGDKVEIVWEAEIEILQDGWSTWRKTTALKIRKTMH